MYTLPTGQQIDLSTPAGVAAGRAYLQTVLVSASDPVIAGTINGLIGAWDQVTPANYADPVAAYTSILGGLNTLPNPTISGTGDGVAKPMDMTTVLLIGAAIYLAWKVLA